MSKTRSRTVNLPLVLCVLALPLAGCRSSGSVDGDSPGAAREAASGTFSAATAPATEPSLSRPGFIVQKDNRCLWVLRPGEERSDRYVSLVGAGPRGMTVRALDADTAFAYLAWVPGFEVDVEDGCLWVLRPGQQRRDAQLTLPGIGPRGMTVKAVDRGTVDDYLAAFAAAAEN